MRFEHHRLSTFANYNNADAPSLLLMAKYGWYATGFGNETKTFCCSVVNTVWSKDDNPLDIHKNFQPGCSFILGCDLGQVSIQDDRNESSSLSHANSSSAVLGTQCNGASALSNDINLSGTENHGEIALQTEVSNMNPSALSIEHKAKDVQFPSSTPNFKDKHGISKDVKARFVCDRSDHEYVEQTRCLTSDSRLTSSFNADCPSTSVEPAARIKSSDNLSDADRVNVTDMENRPRPATWNKQDRESETIHDKPHSDLVYQEPVLPPLGPEKPKHVEYTTVGIRASSFSGFPIGSRKTPKEFAIGGFYYRGFGDRTTCFQCGISLQNWSADDDVFVEHARHNPLCQYIRQLKGDDFVKLVLIATGTHEVNTPQSSGNQEESIVKQLIEMGFEKDLIISTIKRTHLTNGQLTLQNVLDSVIETTNAPTSTTSSEYMKTKPVNANSNSNCSGFENNLSTDLKPEDDRFMCKICMEIRVGIVFTPCGHIASCPTCAMSLLKCPICRHVIQERIRTEV